MNDPFETLDRINAEWDEIPGYLGQSPKFWQHLADFGGDLAEKEKGPELWVDPGDPPIDLDAMRALKPPKAFERLAKLNKEGLSEADVYGVISGILCEAIDEIIAQQRECKRGPDWLAITREFG